MPVLALRGMGIGALLLARQETSLDGVVYPPAQLLLVARDQQNEAHVSPVSETVISGPSLG